MGNRRIHWGLRISGLYIMREELRSEGGKESINEEGEGGREGAVADPGGAKGGFSPPLPFPPAISL